MPGVTVFVGAVLGCSCRCGRDRTDGGGDGDNFSSMLVSLGSCRGRTTGAGGADVCVW